MTRHTRLAALALAAALLAGAVPAVPASASTKPAPPVAGKPHAGELVVGYERSAAASVDAATAAEGGSVARRSPRGTRALVRAKDARSARRLRERLAGLRGVRYVEPYIEYKATLTPTDPHYADQWGLPRIGAPAAWDVTLGGAGTKIAIVDTGVDIEHPEFAGRIDTANDYDFVNRDSNADDDEGHGTHVAGIAAGGINNGVEGCGVAPGCTILPVKVLDQSGRGSNSDVADGIEWAADHGADVINLSLGSRYYSQAIADAVDYAQSQLRDVLVVAAAGNDGSTVSYPGKLAGVVTVSAANSGDGLASFSNRGPEVDLAAPGVDVYSTLPLPAAGEYWDGTSMASPFVAGAAALVRSRMPALTADEVAQVLYGAADDIGAVGKDNNFGYGMLQVDGALAGPPSGADVYEPDGSAAQATPATLDTGYTHTADPLGDADWHSFTAVAGHSYRIRTMALMAGADTVVTLFEADGSTEITASDDVDYDNGDLSSLVSWTATGSGTYYFRNLDLWGRGGSYRIMVSDITAPAGDSWEPDNTMPTARGITLGVPTTHTASPIGESDFMYLDATAGSTYHFFTDELTDVADTYLYLWNEDGNKLAEHDDRDYYGGDLSSEIYWTATRDERLYIENYDYWEAGGGYRLTVEDITPPRDAWEPDDTLPTARLITLGVPATHTAAPAGESDCAYFDQVIGHTYAVETTQLVDGADTYVYAYRSTTGQPFVRNDDRDADGGDYSSRMEWTADYSGRVYVKNQDRWEAGGGYTLTATDLSSPTVDVEALAGADRYGTAALVSASAFPTGSAAVLIATGANYPDALAAGSLAGAWDAPVLLVPSSGTLPAAVADEVERLGATRAFVLGGTGAVSGSMASQVQAHLAGAATVTRYGGADRYATARLVGGAARAKLVADGKPAPDAAFIVTGSGFADALVASPLSFATGEPIVLVPPTLDAATSAFITGGGLTDLTILGGTGSAAAAVASAALALPGVTSVARISAADRYATSVAVAEYAEGRGFTWDGLAVATGEKYPDALAGGCLQGRGRSVVLLTRGAALPPSVGAALTAHKAGIAGVRFLGGAVAISEAARVDVYDALR